MLEQTITIVEYNAQYESINNEIDALRTEIQECQNQIAELENGDGGYYPLQQEYINFLNGNLNYKKIENNYYYRKTLIEFNYDYITSLKLFDSKVVAAQLLDQLTGLLNIDLSISYARQLIKNETLKMVQDIVESDDSVVSDCFFTFSNSDYDAKQLRNNRPCNNIEQFK